MSSASSIRVPLLREHGAPLEPDDVRARTMGQAIYFDSGEHTLFGWLHKPPVAATTNLGLVICKPFGYEALCSHRGLRAFAEAAAAAGVPTLRLDYLGAGDSADMDPRADQLDAW